MKTITVKNKPTLALLELLLEFQDAVLDGYRISASRSETPFPLLMGNNAFMTMSISLSPDLIEVGHGDTKAIEELLDDVKEVPEEIPAPSLSLKDQLEALTKKVEINAFAKANNIEVDHKDPKLRSPQALKKYVASML